MSPSLYVCIVRRTIGKPEELEELAKFNRSFNDEQSSSQEQQEQPAAVVDNKQ